jgi:hypothetical protein
MGAIDLQIEDLLLDAVNPRFARGGGQRDILQKILDDQREKLYALAESIVEDGMNPMDRLLVLRSEKDPAKFIALEGNRRVAALRILANPTVLTGLEIKESLRKRFENLAEKFDRKQVEPIAGFEAPSRETGTSWILLRHTGENEGRGVVSWSGLATSRFRGSDPALQALDFVKLRGNLTEDQERLLDRNDYPITTLDRLLSSREVRSRVGIDVHERKLVSDLPPDELMKPLRRMVLDLAMKRVTVSDLKNQAQQVGYIDSFDSASKPSFATRVKFRPVESISESDFTLKPRRSGGKKRRPDPSERKTVVPRGVTLNIQDNRLAAIFKELKTLKIEDAYNAIAVLLRVFLELSVDHYMRRHKLSLKGKDQKSGKEYDKKLSKKLEEVVDHLVKQTNCNKRDFFGVTRALTDKRSPLHIDLLHAYVHNLFVIPKRHDLIGAWDEAQPLFERIWA